MKNYTHKSKDYNNDLPPHKQNIKSTYYKDNSHNHYYKPHMHHSNQNMMKDMYQNMYYLIRKNYYNMMCNLKEYLNIMNKELYIGCNLLCLEGMYG